MYLQRLSLQGSVRTSYIMVRPLSTQITIGVVMASGTADLFTMTIDGQGVPGESTFEIINPANEQVIARAPDCSGVQLDQAVDVERSLNGAGLPTASGRTFWPRSAMCS
jgi:hypothetical protein